MEETPNDPTPSSEVNSDASATLAVPVETPVAPPPEVVDEAEGESGSAEFAAMLDSSLKANPNREPREPKVGDKVKGKIEAAIEAAAGLQQLAERTGSTVEGLSGLAAVAKRQLTAGEISRLDYNLAVVEFGRSRSRASIMVNTKKSISQTPSHITRFPATTFPICPTPCGAFNEAHLAPWPPVP